MAVFNEDHKQKVNWTECLEDFMREEVEIAMGKGYTKRYVPSISDH